MSAGNRCLLVAEPGAGKTTRAPLALLADTPPEAGRWLLLEPRRVAVRLAANYIAELMGEQVGQTIGYRVRGEQKLSASTRLEVITQGIFTRMLQDDPMLDGVAGAGLEDVEQSSGHPGRHHRDHGRDRPARLGPRHRGTGNLQQPRARRYPRSHAGNAPPISVSRRQGKLGVAPHVTVGVVPPTSGTVAT